LKQLSSKEFNQKNRRKGLRIKKRDPHKRGGNAGGGMKELSEGVPRKEETILSAKNGQNAKGGKPYEGSTPGENPAEALQGPHRG